MSSPEITAAVHERRRRFRFQMDAELRYQDCRAGEADRIRGTGKVENISSKALAFRADGPIVRGMRLSVSLAWPAKIDECILRLTFEGIILRVRGNLAVVSIERPEFRTAGKSMPVALEPGAGTANRIESR